jgi:hypothetical protein
MTVERLSKKPEDHTGSFGAGVVKQDRGTIRNCTA